MPTPLTLPKLTSRLPPYLATTAPIEFASGFYEEEAVGADPYRWMSPCGSVRFAPHPDERFLELWMLSEFHDLSQEIVCAGDGWSERFSLVAGWAPLSVRVPAGADRLDLTVNKPFPREYYWTEDRRTLAVRVRLPNLHSDPVRHTRVAAQHTNGVLNAREMLEGGTTLSSTPVTLGIDLYGECNVKPPCVYCEWDFNKKAEGPNVDVPFTLDTLRGWGGFFDNSVNLVNCSIGEPFMMKNFDDLLDHFGHTGKALEMTTNGQILTERNIQRLIGRTIDLYVSLDAATPETYARLRNTRFDSILTNLRRLIEAKGGPGKLPNVHLVFMPMKANVHELQAFVELAAALRVDRLVLRPLNYSDDTTLESDRAGYRFEYQKELLPFEELVRTSGRAAEWCERAGVPLADQMDFGGALGAEFDQWFEEGHRSAAGSEPGSKGQVENAEVDTPPSAAEPPPAAGNRPPGPLPSLGTEARPACTEPWKSLYILRRGVFPCCYGGAPVAEMADYREAWNSPLLQSIRGDLAAGKFHAYCLRSSACPIVQKAANAGALPVTHRMWLSARRMWPALLRRTSRATDVVKAQVTYWTTRIKRSLLEPGYARRHAKRIWRNLQTRRHD